MFGCIVTNCFCLPYKLTCVHTYITVRYGTSRAALCLADDMCLFIEHWCCC